jgi:hypothetical protein
MPPDRFSWWETTGRPRVAYAFAGNACFSARPASISRHGRSFHPVECGKCCDRFESVGITKPARWKGTAPLPSVQFGNLSVVAGNGSVLNAVSSAWMHQPRLDTLAFQVDLWSARGELPRSLAEVLTRQKEIQYSSRTRASADSASDRAASPHHRRLA